MGLVHEKEKRVCIVSSSQESDLATDVVVAVHDSIQTLCRTTLNKYYDASKGVEMTDSVGLGVHDYGLPYEQPESMPVRMYRGSWCEN